MGKEIFDLSSPGWRWYGASKETKDFLCSHARFDASTLVKINPVRAVFACDGYFIKFEVPDSALRRWRSILAPKAASEYASGKALEKAGIPVVEYLCWMRRKSANAVVSRCWHGGPASAEEHIFNTLALKGFGNGDTVDFACKLRDFTIEFQQKGFRHPDYHTGNLLYAPEQNQLALVDVYGVRRNAPGYWERLAQNKIILSLRPFMPFGALIDILAGFPDLKKSGKAAEFYWDTRRIDAAVQLRALPKRQQQIANGYPKFIKIEKEYFIRKDEVKNLLFTPDDIKDFEVLEMDPAGAFALLQFSIYLQLCGIRHRRVAAWKAPDTLFLEPGSSFRPPSSCGISAEETALLRQEAELFGVTECGDIACDRYGNPCIFDIRKAFESMTLKEQFFQ